MAISEAAKQKLAEHKERKAERRRKRQEQAANANVFSPGREVVWRPQPGPQTALVTCPYPEVLFGGARGGGKTDGCLGAWLYHAGKYGEHARGIFFRRRFKQLEQVQDRCMTLFPKLGALYNKGDAVWVFPNGATLKLRHLWDEQSCEEYQGHEYCVGGGTPILMWDGKYRPIEDIRPGDFVMTLEGPKPVQAAVCVGMKPCVQANVFSASGRYLGSQIHPEDHPVLTSVVEQTQSHSDEHPSASPYSKFPFVEGESELLHAVHQGSAFPAIAKVLSDARPSSNAELLDRHFDGCIQNAEQHPESHLPWQSYTLLRSARLGIQAGVVSQEDGQISGKASGKGHEETLLLARLSVPVVLHGHHLRSGLCDERLSNGSHDLGKSSEPLQPADQLKRYRMLDPLLLDERSQSRPDQSEEKFLVYGIGCVHHDWRKAQGSQSYYRSGRCSCDERLLPAQECGPDVFPLRGDAETQTRVSMPLDGKDCTHEYSHGMSSGYIHPYTKERRPLVVPVESGTAEFSPCGEHLVYDLTVADANHYITKTGLVNKNTFIVIEEATNWNTLGPINKMRATLRSPHGVPTKLILTANPGGSGHNLIKNRYITPARHGYTPIRDPESGEERIFIPSRLENNQVLMQNDPNYERRLMQSGNLAIVKAWRYGDWDIVSGGFFDDLWLSESHLVRPFEIPPTWRWRRSFDWGSASPASLGIWAISDGNPVEALDGFVFPRGSFIRVSEWYTCARDSSGNLRPNEGLRLTNIALGNGIGIRSQDRNFTGCVADPSIFARLGREAIYDEIRKGALEVGHHLIFQPADNNRIAGWQRMRDMLEAAAQERPEKPGLWAFETCEHYARTIPVLQRDESNPDDIDTDQEDHVADEVRYLIMTGARTLSIGTRRGE